MEYKKIENEIDTLLHNGGLNPYERKLLRKVKRKFCADRVAEKDYFEIMGRAATERKKVVFELSAEIEKKRRESQIKDFIISEKDRYLRNKDNVIKTYNKIVQDQKKRIGDLIGWAFFYGCAFSATFFWILNK